MVAGAEVVVVVRSGPVVAEAEAAVVVGAVGGPASIDVGFAEPWLRWYGPSWWSLAASLRPEG